MTLIVDYPFVRVSQYYLDYMSIMSYAEYRIVGCVIRKSVGWGKEFADISYSDFMTYTGIKSRSTVSKTIQACLEKGYIKSDGKEGKRGVKRYALGETLKAPPKSMEEPIELQVKEEVNETECTAIVPADFWSGQPQSTTECTSQISTKNVKPRGRQSTTECTSTSTVSVPVKRLTGTVSVPHIYTIKLIDKIKDKKIRAVHGFSDAHLPDLKPLEIIPKTITLPPEEQIWDPVINVYHDADNIRKPEKTYSDIQKLQHVVMRYFDCDGLWGVAGRMAKQFNGSATGKRGGENLIDPPMTPEEACVFGHWLECVQGITIRNSETIWEQSLVFRSEPLHNAYLEFAPYLLDDVMASFEYTEEPVEEPPELTSIDDNPQALKAIAQLEAQLGYEIFGDDES